jgi:hypothetical protein
MRLDIDETEGRLWRGWDFVPCDNDVSRKIKVTLVNREQITCVKLEQGLQKLISAQTHSANLQGDA